MIKYCLMNVHIEGVETEKVLKLLSKLAKQDYRKPIKPVGLLSPEQEAEFSNVIVIWSINRFTYFTDTNPNTDTLIKLAKKYNLFFQCQFENIDGLRVGMCHYDSATDVFGIVDCAESEFYGFSYSNGYYTYEGKVYDSRFHLRNYVIQRKERDQKLEKILNLID